LGQINIKNTGKLMNNIAMCQAVKNSIETFTQTKKMIEFDWQFEFSIQCDSIKPEHFSKRVYVDKGKSEIIVDFDWAQHPQAFRECAKMTKISIISFWIIQCREIYHDLFNKKVQLGLDVFRYKAQEEIIQSYDQDLYAAQTILCQIRHALGHFKALDSNYVGMPIWDFKNSNPGCLEIKQINVILDTTVLQDKQFEWKHIGGISSFLRVLDFLKQDLENRLNLYDSLNS
jgi:hypothetical protein